MNTNNLAKLENVIEQWIAELCENGDNPDTYIYDDLHADMAKAAATVFEANTKSQKFVEDNYT